jgi:hypothetical protein
MCSGFIIICTGYLVTNITKKNEKIYKGIKKDEIASSVEDS